MRTLIVAVVALIACKPRPIDFKKSDLPGFSVDLPDETTTGTTVKYRQGEVHMDRDGKFVVVSWQAGTIASAQELPALIKTMGTVVPELTSVQTGRAHPTKIGGQDATELDARVDGVSVYFADVACGKRAILLGIAAAGDIEELRSRIVSSFQCHPVATEEQQMTEGAPIGIDDPTLLEGWTRMPNDEAYMITDGHVILLFTDIAITEPITSSTMRKLIPQLFQAYGGQWENGRTEVRTAGSTTREFQLGTLTAQGNKMPGAITMWSCPGNGVVLSLVLIADGSDMLPGLDLVTKMRCAKPGDPPLPVAGAPKPDPKATVPSQR
jgi:hypothetical protein